MPSHEWVAYARDPDYGLSVELPISSISIVRRHLGVSTAVIKTPLSVQRLAALQPSCGAVLYRDGVQEFNGMVAELAADYDPRAAEDVITVQLLGDEQHLADRLVFPDPLRAADDQTVNDYWSYPPGGTLPLRTQAAQDILGRIASGEPYNLNWTWRGIPPYTQMFADGLQQQYVDDGGDPGDGDAAQTWLTTYIAANSVPVSARNARASTAMWQLISDQAGPTAQADRRVPGLAMGADPGTGESRLWTGLFGSVLEQLTVMSVASGSNLGVRMTSSAGTLLADVVAGRDLADSVVFSTELSNLAGVSYRIGAPSVTHALSAGQGDLHARLRKLVVSTDPLALQWGRQVWDYIDRRDTADVNELVKAGSDGLAGGGPTVSLAVTLLDSDAATYRLDWDLGDYVTVLVGRPGTAKTPVSDVAREVLLTVDSDGAESVRPAIGSYDAKALVPTPTERKLADVGQALAGLIARK